MATLKELIGEGYNENLSHAEIDNLLKDRSFFDLATGNYVALGKYMDLKTERDDYKQKYLDKLTEDEKRAEKDAEREKYYAQLERTNNINEYAKSLSHITDEKTRLEIAELLADGKIMDATKKQSEYQANNEAQLRETIKQELLSSNPTPPPIETTPSMSKEKFRSLSLQEKQEMATKDPENYKKYTT
jgi:predicted nuclease with TOPRIM domain